MAQAAQELAVILLPQHEYWDYRREQPCCSFDLQGTWKDEGFPNIVPVNLRSCLFSEQPEGKGTCSSELLPLIMSLSLANNIYGPPY